MIGVVGSTNVDIVLKVERFTKPGETQKALSVEKFPGGKGANQAVSVAKLSKRETIFITLVGNDEDGRWMIDRFKSLKIVGPRIVDTQTGKAFIELTLKGENRIIIHPGANGILTPDKVDWDLLERVDIVLLQNEIPFETTLEVARFSKERKKTVVFDPAPASGIDGEIMKYVDFLTPNETEMEELSKSILGEFEGIERSAERFLEMGVGAVVVKLGERGVYFKSGLKEVRIPAPKVDAVDTTAAGDVFNGAFAVALDSKRGILDALRFAVLSASLSVTKMGAQTSVPSIEEVIDFERRVGQHED